MERRGRIPIAKFRTQEGKTRSRSRVREPDYNEQDPETDLFTLLEDNIALKEENKALKLEIEDHKKIQNELLEDSVKMRDEFDTLRIQHRELEEDVKKLSLKLSKTNDERSVLDKLLKVQVERNDALSLELQEQQQQPKSISTTNIIMLNAGNLQNKLLKILPTLSSNEMESLVDVEATAATPINAELVERLADEYLALKNLMNAVELQLYEANEKISELLENQHHMEEENETIRTENTNLTRVAKLLTENMKESVETSKKMEAAFIKLKQRNEQLIAKAHDFTDGGRRDSNATAATTATTPTSTRANTEFEQIQKELHAQNLDHGERIVEMKTLMEAAIEKTTNDELKSLQLKLEILEEELRKALSRATNAESELEKLKNPNTSPNNRSSLSAVAAPSTTTIRPTTPPPLPPPPPPPLPATLLYQPTTLSFSKKPLNVHSDGILSPTSSSSSTTTHNNPYKPSNSSGGGGDKIIGNIMQQVHAEAATGVDALVREFKSGRVTLRRNRRKTRTNEALQEMFQVLEISQKQNRDSKICIDLHT